GSRARPRAALRAAGVALARPGGGSVGPEAIADSAHPDQVPGTGWAGPASMPELKQPVVECAARRVVPGAPTRLRYLLSAPHGSPRAGEGHEYIELGRSEAD